MHQNFLDHFLYCITTLNLGYSLPMIELRAFCVIPLVTLLTPARKHLNPQTITDHVQLDSLADPRLSPHISIDPSEKEINSHTPTIPTYLLASPKKWKGSPRIIKQMKTLNPQRQVSPLWPMIITYYLTNQPKDLYWYLLTSNTVISFTDNQIKKRGHH